MGLTIHRILQWIATISTTVIATMIISGMDTWDQLKANAVRMETVPGDVRAIKEQGERTSAKVEHLEWRVDGIEKYSAQKHR